MWGCHVFEGGGRKGDQGGSRAPQTNKHIISKDLHAAAAATHFGVSSFTKQSLGLQAKYVIEEVFGGLHLCNFPKTAVRQSCQHTATGQVCRGTGTSFSNSIFSVFTHNYFLLRFNVQTSATLWMSLRSDCLKVCEVDLIIVSKPCLYKLFLSRLWVWPLGTIIMLIIIPLARYTVQ